MATPTRRVYWAIFSLLALLLLAGCGAQTLDISATIENLQNFNMDDPQVGALTANIGDYLAVYSSQYAVKPRRGTTPLAITEAYLRQYQPGPLPRVFQTTTVYDRHGTKLAEIADEGYRTWVPIERISPNFVSALLATEDATFFENPGYDARRVVRAIMQNAEAGGVISGASTITMQLARQLFFTPDERFDQTMERKIFEALLAQDLTNTYSKDEILEMYLNMVHFGRTLYGIEAASQFYFGKSAASLNMAEATLLAGIPQAPADYDPIANFDLVKQRQGVVLSLMVRHGVLTQKQADAVFATKFVFNTNIQQRPLFAPHFVQYVLSEVNRMHPDEDVRRSGSQIFTTLDLPMQQLAERVVLEQVNTLRPVYDLSNAALVALKPGTAEILVMVGSADFSNSAIAGQVNVAVASRQPGSAIKPVLYSLAMNDLQISPATIIWDVESKYNLDKTELYQPINYDKSYHGPVTARTALANSYNVPAVKLLDAVTVDRMLDGARAMGIQSLTRDTNWYGLSLTLGGGEVTLLDLTTAYHTIANSGQYVKPQLILYATGGSYGHDLSEVQPKPVQAISPEAAYLVTNILSDNRARTPAFGENSVLRLSKPAAAKTGTTNDYRDNWTEGYTRYLVAGVWAGNSDGHPMRNVSGVTGAAPIWHAFMEAVLADPSMLAMLGAPSDPSAWDFIVPPGIVKQAITCPPGVTCNQEEVFDKRWLQKMGNQSATGDSEVVALMNTVYMQRGNGSVPVGACSADDGATRQLLRLPVGLTRGLEQIVSGQSKLDNVLVADPSFQDTGKGQAVDTERARRIRDEQRGALAWSAKQGSPLYFGPCDQVETVVRQVFGNSVSGVSISSFSQQITRAEPAEIRQDTQDAQNTRDTQDTQDTQVATLAVASTQQNSAQPSSSYNPAGVAHDNSCGGDYVSGSVYNATGQLVQAVAVVYSDDLGNHNYAAAVNGAYRFPVGSPDTPHNIYISLVDAAGNPVSATVTVPHHEGGASDLGCHYVVWQGAN